jgi:alkanesulfonate monooxygenase SsuD/methylene tetrahydromethanopterin reductase-like flavin-dependent oxidoreductase (luciferase family)
MKFGLFYPHQVPRPWDGRSEYRVLSESLDQIELADQLGYDFVWETEHHFLEEYSHSSAPEVFLGAASQRTKNIRLGHGIVQLTTNQPQRVAERVSTLDVLSNGRVELGMGEGAGPAELHPFNIRVRTKRDRWVEAVRAIVPMFSETSWEFHGEFYDFEARNVVPKPIQRPHPPLWVGCSNIQTIGNAAEWGMGALGFSFVSPEAARAWVHRYFNVFLNHPNRLGAYKTNPNVAIVNGFLCAETDDEAREKAADWTFFQFALGRYGRKGIDNPGGEDMWADYQEWRHSEKAQAALNMGLIGSPDTIRERLKTFESSHVDQVIFLVQVGKMRHEDICASLRLFAKEVMPEFHARDAEHQRWKDDVLNRRITLEELTVEGFDLFAHQNEDNPNRLIPDQLKALVAEKEARGGIDRGA